MKIIWVSLITFLANAVGATICLSQQKDISPAEEHLKAIIEKRKNAYDYDERAKYEDEFETELLRFLQKKESFKSTFPQLPIQIASSPDGKFRIYTWDTTLGGTWHHMAGVVQWLDTSKKVHAQLLDDVSGFIEADFDTTRNIWIGAIYSEVYPLSVKRGQTCYLAIGWTTWGAGTQTKVVEVFEPSNTDIRIGKPIFEFEGRRRVRLLFVYARWEKMNLEYNPETKVLKFDNLVEPVFEPDKEGSPNWRKPDGTVRYLEFRQDHFIETKS